MASKRAKNKRLTILPTEEIDAYFGLPRFTDAERSHYFSLSNDEHKLSQTLSSHTQWYFILQLGFFKAKKQFFIINHRDVAINTRFIAQTYQGQKPRKKVSEDTHRKIRKMILKHLDVFDDSQESRDKIQQRADELTKSTLDTKSIFDSLYDFVTKSKYIIPKYSTFQNIISNALKQESLRLQNILENLLPQYATKALNKLLAIDNNYYEITAVKKDQKNFRHEEVKKLLSIRKITIAYTMSPKEWCQNYRLLKAWSSIMHH